jgi:hypothetical protein
MQAMIQAGLTEALGLGRSTLQTKSSARGANATQMSLHSNDPDMGLSSSVRTYSVPCWMPGAAVAGFHGP